MEAGMLEADEVTEAVEIERVGTTEVGVLTATGYVAISWLAKI